MDKSEIEIWLSDQEKKVLDEMIDDATKFANEVGLSEKFIPDFMEILTTAFLYGILAARKSQPDITLN